MRLTDEQVALRDSLRALLAKESSPERVRAAEPLGFDPDLWRHLNSFGIPAMGLDAGMVDLAIVAFEAGRHLASAPVVESLVATRLLRRDPGEQLPTIAINGPRLVPAGAVANVVVVLDGDELVAVTSEPAGHAPLNLGGTPLADRVLTGDREVLATGEQARTRWAGAADELRTLTAAALAGLARAALDLGVAYAQGRVQFGVPIGSFQAVQQRLADVATTVNGAELLAFEAATSVNPGLASMAFLFAAEAADEAAAVGLHVHGGYGFMLEYDAQLHYRRAKGWSLALGDPRRELIRLATLLPLPEPPDDFRDQVRDHLRRHLTDEVREEAHRTGTEHDWGFHRTLVDRGWVDTSKLDPFEALTLKQELGRAGVPIDGWGVSELVAHTLERAGTEEQKGDVVPRILAGEVLVCLGYSEPDAGSDVASVTTRAVRDGDDWIIDGQKMFTTLAHVSTYVFLLTRTNPAAVPHRGLTMFLVPMDTTGIEVRPVDTLGGERTNITFYTRVRVDDRWRVGEVDGGWDVMKVALAFERNPTALATTMRLLDQAETWARETGRRDDPLVAERLARVAVDIEVGRLLGRRMVERSAAGELPIVEGSMAKLWSSEALVRAASNLLDMLGPEGVLQHGEPGAPAEGWIEHAHRHAPVTTIYAGTSEIQRSIIAERGLGLPRSR